MEKKKASKRATPSLRTKKKSNEKQKSSSRQATHGSRTVSSSRNKKEGAAKTSKSTNEGVPKSMIVVEPDTMTDKDNKKKDEKRKHSVVKKKPSDVEKKLDVTQDDCTKEDPKAAVEVVSNQDIVPDKNPAKMDDGYEDFGPGAA